MIHPDVVIAIALQHRQELATRAARHRLLSDATRVAVEQQTTPATTRRPWRLLPHIVKARWNVTASV
jgi:hypothetical protein